MVLHLSYLVCVISSIINRNCYEVFQSKLLVLHLISYEPHAGFHNQGIFRTLPLCLDALYRSTSNIFSYDLWC